MNNTNKNHFQETENNLQANLRSEDPFSIKINGQVIDFKAVGNGIEYKIDENPATKYFEEYFNKSFTNKESPLNREKILEAFTGHVKDAIFGGMEYIEFKDVGCCDYVYYKACKSANYQLEDITCLDELYEVLGDAKKTNYTFWKFEGNQAFSQKYSPKKEEHFSSP